ncbi:mitochondrial genome maintenance MGM101 [Xylaria sp. CBS 124048]|nr:mitochondrial genome maintenance MGM101 [Xylaria sp. CBS 124048]
MASRSIGPLRAASQLASIVPKRAFVSRRLASTTAAKLQQSLTFNVTTRPSPSNIFSPATFRSASTTSAAETSTGDNSASAAPQDPLAEVAPKNISNGNGDQIDWTNSFHGIGSSVFSAEATAILQAPLRPDEIEVKPDGIIYLPEIKYRRILNSAFGPGGWGLAPRGDLMVRERLVTREYALVVHGRFVGQARGEQQYFNEDGVSTASEGCKSNALMRCCKDLGIASELWDPRFIRKFMKEHAVQQWVEHVPTKKKKQIWLRKDDEVRYPFKKS